MGLYKESRTGGRSFGYYNADHLTDWMYTNGPIGRLINLLLTTNYSRLINNEPLHIIGLGAGIGTYEIGISYSIARHTTHLPKLTLVDLNHDLLDASQEKNTALSASLIKADLRHPPITRNSFDMAFFHNVGHFYTVPDRTNILIKVKDFLNQKGLIFWLEQSLWRPISAFINPYPKPDRLEYLTCNDTTPECIYAVSKDGGTPYRLINRPQMAKIAQDVGLDILESGYSQGETDKNPRRLVWSILQKNAIIHKL
mgnify:FL=1